MLGCQRACGACRGAAATATVQCEGRDTNAFMHSRSLSALTSLEGLLYQLTKQLSEVLGLASMHWTQFLL